MYVKTLTLKGFKSFCDRTRLSFDPGLTVVVGPNGSGKSNVSDAILWVLGEQSPKTLRGQAMEDVVFAGSAQRQAVSVAEVTLVLDNSDRALMLDFSEIAITRRMYRSGESEYLVNGAPVRLRDIRDLLYDMGLGRDTHSIISQGRLGEVLQSKPEERRELIEEAAGIAKFRQRKERAERKLKRLEEDVRRIRDYVRLLRRELRPLEKQVDQFRAVSELEERKASLETVLAVDDVRQLQSQWNRVDKARSEAEAESELASYKLKEQERELAQIKKLLEEKGLFVGDLEAQRHRSQQILQKVSAGLRLLEEKGRHLVDKLSESRRQGAAYERELKTVEEELSQSTQELTSAQESYEKTQAALERLKPQEATAKKLAAKDAQALERARRETQRAHRRVNDATLSHTKLSQQLQNATVAQELFRDRLREVEAQEAAAQETQNEQHGILQELEALEVQYKERALALQKDIDELSHALSEAKREKSQAETQLFEATTEKTTLERWAERGRGSHSCQEAVMRAIAEAGATPHQVVNEVAIPAEFQGAFATYLGEDLFGFFCSSEALSVVTAAVGKSSRVTGRASLITPVAKASEGVTISEEAERQLRPLKALQAQSQTNETQDAHEAPSHEHYERLDELLSGLFCVEDVKEGLELLARYPRARAFLAKDGSVVLGDGRVRVGEPEIKSTEALERAQRLRELKELLPRYRNRFNQAAKALVSAEEAFEAKRQEKQQLTQELADVEIRTKAAHRELGRVKEASQRAAKERAKLERQQEETLQSLAQRRVRLEELSQELEAAKAHLSACQERIPALSEAAEHSLAQANGLQDELTTERLAATRLGERTTSLTTRVGSLTQRFETLQNNKHSLEATVKAMELLRERVGPLHGLMDELHSVALRTAALLQDQSSVAEADSATLKKSVQAAEQELDTAQKAVMAASAHVAQTKADAHVIEEAVRQATEKLRSLHTLELEEALTLEAPQDRDAMERELHEVAQKIEAFGPVNRAALAQYEAGKERLEAVQGELNDLTGAKEALAKISRAIEKKMRQRFVETFATVNQHFSEVFQTLFAGGDARLEMSDPDHPDETGIVIHAQPPQKRVAKMTLLSGGEQSLTALALLFAIYRTRTVPFYVFDEVEQALDDANLNKLLQSLTTLKHQTQLIVISHQRRTMEQADVLYGVSMGADGVSRAVSQRLSDFREEDQKMSASSALA